MGGQASDGALRSLRVHLDERSYPIRIGYDSLAAAGPAIADGRLVVREAEDGTRVCALPDDE